MSLSLDTFRLVTEVAHGRCREGIFTRRRYVKPFAMTMDHKVSEGTTRTFCQELWWITLCLTITYFRYEMLAQFYYGFEIEPGLVDTFGL